MKFWLNKVLYQILTNYLFAWLAILVIARIPSLFDYLRGVDEDYYMVIAQSLSKGGRLYIDIWDNKPPFLYFVYLFNYILVGPSLIGVRCVGLLLSFFSLIRFKQILELQIFNLSKQKIFLVFSLFAFLTTFGWQTVTFNAENLFLPLITFGFYYWTRNLNDANFDNLNYYKGLIWFALAGFTKFNSLIEVLALLFIYLVILFKDQTKSQKHVIQSLRETSIIRSEIKSKIKIDFQIGLKGLLIIASPYLILILVYGFWNKLPELYFGIFGFGGSYIPRDQLLLRVFFYVGFICISLFLFLKSKISKLQYWVWNLCGIELFAILLSGRGYHHYLIQGFLGFGLLIALFLKEKFRILKTLILGISILLFLTSFLNTKDIWSGFGTDTNYNLFLKTVMGQTTFRQWQLDGRPDAQLAEVLVPIIQNHTQSTDKIYLFANKPFIYSLANRLPAYPYPVEYQYHEPLEEVYLKIKKNEAKLIILDNKLENYSKYKELIQSDYKLNQIINSQWEVYFVNKTS